MMIVREVQQLVNQKVHMLKTRSSKREKPIKIKINFRIQTKSIVAVTIVVFLAKEWESTFRLYLFGLRTWSKLQKTRQVF